MPTDTYGLWLTAAIGLLNTVVASCANWPTSLVRGLARPLSGIATSAVTSPARSCCVGRQRGSVWLAVRYRLRLRTSSQHWEDVGSVPAVAITDDAVTWLRVASAVPNGLGRHIRVSERDHRGAGVELGGNSGRVQLLSNRKLIVQLHGLERRTARGGKDSIDHGSGRHDDLANAAAGALVMASAFAATITFHEPVVHSRPRADMFGGGGDMFGGSTEKPGGNPVGSVSVLDGTCAWSPNGRR